MFGRDGKLFGVSFVKFADLPKHAIATNEDYRATRLGNNVIVLLSDCCSLFKCRFNLQDIPERVQNTMFKWVYSAIDTDMHPGYCSNDVCGFPLACKEAFAFQYFVIGQWLFDYFVLTLNWNVLFANDHVVQVFYTVAERVQQRVNRAPVRRNVINAVFFLPYYNAYKCLHQTFKYRPRNVAMKTLVERILIEAKGYLLQQLYESNFKGFHCQCK